MNETAFEATVMCPYCGHEFRACIRSDHHPRADESYEVNCPCHGGPFEFVAAGSKNAEQVEAEYRDKLAWGEGPFPVYATSLQHVEKCKSGLPDAHLVPRKPHMIKRFLACLRTCCSR